MSFDGTVQVCLDLSVGLEYQICVSVKWQFVQQMKYVS